MWDINKTKAWYIDSAGEEIQLEPICYTQDAENNRILITRDGIYKYKIPLIIPNKANKQTTSVDVLHRKQKIKRGSITYEIDELVFSTDRRIRNCSFYAKVEPALLRKSYLWVKNTFCWFRNLLENIRKKNPELYDGITKLISVLWEVMVAILGFVSDLSPKKIASIACISYIIVLAVKVGSERNRADRMINKERNRSEAEINKIKKEIEKTENACSDVIIHQMCTSEKERKMSLFNLSKISHDAAHHNKECILNLRRMKKRADCLDILADYLKNCADNLEFQLSYYYNEKISVSIKLADTQSSIKTYTRGKNNLESRELIGMPSIKDSVDIEKNIAYKHIFQEENNCFRCGNLQIFKKRLSNGSFTKFYCEYEDWKNIFLSTIIIPIRWRMLHEEKYMIAGVICVDCKKKMPEWDNSSSYAYQLTAFFADLLYILIEDFSNKNEDLEG